MSKKTIQDYILDIIPSEWTGKCDIIKRTLAYMKLDKEIASHESIGRRLRNMAENGLIQKDYYASKKNHPLAKYMRA